MRIIVDDSEKTTSIDLRDPQENNTKIIKIKFLDILFKMSLRIAKGKYSQQGV